MYIRYISTLLCNWLVKHGCKKGSEAKVTESRYVSFGDTRIRISAHLPCNMSGNWIYIMVPSDRKESFGVFIDKNFHTFSDVKELKEFLSAMLKILDSKSYASLCKYKMEISKLEGKMTGLTKTSK